MDTYSPELHIQILPILPIKSDPDKFDISG